MTRLRPAACMLLLLLVSCGGLLAPAAATVNGEKITIDDIQSAVEDFQSSPEYERLAEQGDAGAITREFEQSYLSQLIRRAVLVPEAKRLEIEVTQDEIDEQLELIRSEFPSESAFQEALKEQGLRFDQLEDLVRDRALEEKLKAEVTGAAGPSEDELRTYYEEHTEDFLQSSLQHVLVEERALAADISRRLRAAPPARVEELFARLAKRHSTDRSNKDLGGELGFNPPGTFVPAFEAAADALEVGEISGPVKTRFGYHIIRVVDREPQPFEEVQEAIQAELGAPPDEEIWEEWLIDAYDEADVKVNPRYGEFNPETQLVEDASARTVPGAEESPAADTSPTPGA